MVAPYPSRQVTGRAACLGLTERFYAVDEMAHGFDRDALIAWCKSVCEGCPIKAECLAAAKARREPFGIWGGMTATERNPGRSAKRRVTATAPTEAADKPSRPIQPQPDFDLWDLVFEGGAHREAAEFNRRRRALLDTPEPLDEQEAA